ncbi:hypothetical protein CAPTEDRAFT_187109 [Capitella teleta]|uniref:Tetraspanin n=1 Tax=Capitella teleta TaxID=283909 RepID=R7VIU4_CAPTE|nr:hypothetical protein CAPTEDRAFT_187109 [Capitella teleta]|eukprot:ELU15635.1 hypothetical protein CAPTEDRAFT_187109 [Capitella teleta]
MCCLPQSLSKLLLIVFNVIFFVLGLGLVILGIFLLVDDSVILQFAGKLPLGSDVVEEGVYGTSWLSNFAYILLVAGGFFLVVGGAGLFGACCNSQCLLIVYATIVTLLIILEIAAGVVAVLFKDKVETYLQTYLTGTLQKYYTGATYNDGAFALSTDTSGVSDGWDYAQIQLKCCGVSNKTDWAGATQWPASYNISGVPTAATVPITCCVMDDPTKFPDAISEVTFTDLSTCLSTGNDPAAHTTVS